MSERFWFLDRGGIEPPTFRMRSERSTAELTARDVMAYGPIEVEESPQEPDGKDEGSHEGGWCAGSVRPQWEIPELQGIGYPE